MGAEGNSLQDDRSGGYRMIGLCSHLFKQWIDENISLKTNKFISSNDIDYAAPKNIRAFFPITLAQVNKCSTLIPKTDHLMIISEASCKNIQNLHLVESTAMFWMKIDGLPRLSNWKKTNNTQGTANNCGTLAKSELNIKQKRNINQNRYED